MPSILNKFSRLRIDRAKGVAPHKPLLLLCLMEIAEQGDLEREILPVTGELAFRFAGYWSVVAHRRPQRPDVKLPLFHMKSDGFWLPLDEGGNILKHRELPAYIRFLPDFLSLANDPDLRKQAQSILIRTYFEASEQVALCALTGCDINEIGSVESNSLLNDPEAVERGRVGRFRIGVVTAYNYTCALTGYRLITLNAGTIVDACHIHPFAESRNNATDNGIALSKNAHWLLDNGLWSLNDDYTVIVAKRCFSEAGESAFLLSRMQTRKISLPINPEHWPSLKHLQWHRNHKFLG